VNQGGSRMISRGGRIVLVIVGLASWAAGAVAVFLSTNGAGAAALVITGCLSGGLGLVGRWPSRVAVSGNEISWENIDQTMESQIRVAQQDDDGTALRELLSLRDRLAVLQETGSVPMHPAEAYDQAVTAAIRRLLPGAEVIAQGTRSRATPDFTIEYQGSALFLETKWRVDPSDPFGGSTLPVLLAALPAGASLLVVTSTSVPPLPRAYQILQDALGDRGRIACWLDVRDDKALAEALAALIGAQARGGEGASRNGARSPTAPRPLPRLPHRVFLFRAAATARLRTARRTSGFGC
jgi:hypothetical protein